MKALNYSVKTICLQAFLLQFLMGCSFDHTTLSLESLFEPTWDFSNSSKLSFDSNYLEVKDGAIAVKPLDLVQESTNLLQGNLAGASLNDQQAISLSLYDLQESDAANILPAKASQLSGYWRFQDNLNDETGSYSPGVVSNDPKYITTRFLKGIEFDGVDDSADLGEWNGDETNYTVALWFQPHNETGYKTLFHRGDSIDCFYNPKINYDFDSEELAINESGCGGSGNLTKLTLSPSEWSHIVVSRQGSQMKIYINGILQLTETVGGGVGATQTGRIFLAANHSSGSGASGFGAMTINELSTWNTTLSDSEVLQIYQQQSKKLSTDTELTPDWAPRWDQLMGYWKLNGHGKDSSDQNNHGNIVGSMDFSSSSKVGSHSAIFDGINGRLDIPYNANLAPANTLTVSTWFKATDINNSLRMFSTTETGGYHLSLNENAACPPSTLCFLAYIGSFQSANIPVSELASNVWYHAVGTYDGETLKLYLNGVLKAENTSPSGSITYAHNNSACIGAEPTTTTCAGFFFDGQIDDTGVWSAALTSSQIKKIYEKQKQKYSGTVDSPVLNTGRDFSWPDLSWSTSHPFLKELVAKKDGSGSFTSESVSDYSLMVTDLMNELVFYMPMNESALNTLGSGDFANLANTNFNGEESGGVTPGVRGKLNSSIYLDGINNRVRVSDYDDLNFGTDTHFTISGWVKTTSTNSAFFVGKEGAALTPLITTFAHSSLAGAPRGYVSPGDGTFCTVDGSYPINDGQWHHLTFVYNRNSVCTSESIHLYIDGVRDTAATLSSGTAGSSDFNLTSANDLYIGQRYSTASTLQGNIDEVAIWARSLSAQEVLSVYRRGANRVKLQVKSCKDALCQCKDYSSFPQGNATDCDGDSIANSIDYEDAYKAEFTGPGGDGSTFFNESFHRNTLDISYNCSNNSTDNNGNICVNDEMTFLGSSLAKQPIVNYSLLPLSARPIDNPYFQYRVVMESDDNLACNGSPCLPDIQSVGLSSEQTEQFSGQVQEVRALDPLVYKTINSVSVNAEDCVSYQLSTDGSSFYYFESGLWQPATQTSHRLTKSQLETQIQSFAEQFGPGQLYLKAFLQAPTATSSCRLISINVSSSL